MWCEMCDWNKATKQTASLRHGSHVGRAKYNARDEDKKLDKIKNPLVVT